MIDTRQRLHRSKSDRPARLCFHSPFIVHPSSFPIPILCVFAVFCTSTFAFIDRKFTPIDFVKQADTIAPARVKNRAGKDAWKLEIDEALKGKAAGEALLRLVPDARDAEKIRALFGGNPTPPALLFAATQGNETRGFLHVGTEWLELKDAGGATGGGDTARVWEIGGLSPQMAGSYAGGADSLIEMTRYILADPEATVPVDAGTRWMERSKVGKVEGDVAGVAAVDLVGDGTVHLFVGATGGDRLFRPKQGEEAMVEVTAAAKLDTRSRRFAWVDWNRDGRVDLASFDGAAISIRLVNPDGTLAAVDAVNTFKIGAACLGLAPLSVSADGAPALLASTSDTPFLIGADGERTELPAFDAGAEGSGNAAACITADLDGDGFVDVLQPRETGGVLWKGTAGGFEKPVASPVAASGAKARTALGDFNGDGFLDVFVSDTRRNQLWQNDGKAGFRPVIALSGSLGRDNPAGAADCRAIDLNHDGRTDLAIGYADKGFVYHFNRGYRCMGEEGELRLEGKPFSDKLESVGVLSFGAADFNEGGAYDLAVVHANGDVYCYYNDMFDVPGVSVRLPEGRTGAATVSVWQGKAHPYCVGAQTVDGHMPPPFFSLRKTGNCTLRYSLPGKPNRTRTVNVTDESPTVTIGE